MRLVSPYLCLPLTPAHTDGDPIVAEFFVKYAFSFSSSRHSDLDRRYADHAVALNVSSDGLYASLLADAENSPLNVDLQGRIINLWKQYGMCGFKRPGIA